MGKEFSSRPFEKLRKSLERANTPTTQSVPIQKKKKDELTDDELFNNEMEDVQVIEAFRRLSCFRTHPAAKQQQPAARRSPEQDGLAVLTEIAAGQRPINLPDTQEYVEWVNPDYQETITAKLHQGHFSVQAYLDLHGFTVPEAEDEVEVFLREAFVKGLSCIKIIHGRGLRSVNGPRIKNAVTRRLLGRHRKDVIAYVSARQCDGGLGALYVLLKKRGGT